MSGTLVASLSAMQRPDGRFDAIARRRDGSEIPDANGFVTALVLRRLRHAPDLPGLGEVTSRALDAIVQCRVPGRLGAYAFWPAADRPDWARAVPADVDDTALMLTELYRYGRVGRAEVLRCVVAAILPGRVTRAECAVLPPWVAEGSYFTWIADAASPAVNIVDACVNANVVALLALVGMRHLAGYDAAVRTVIAGVEWAGDDPVRLDALTPFYPAPGCFLEALDHAVECGAADLRPAADRLRALDAQKLYNRPGLCRDAYGRTVWHASAVDTAGSLEAQYRQRSSPWH